MDQYKVIIADDHEIVRVGLRSILERDKRFRVVADVDDGIKTVRTVEEHQPDILIFDLLMPALDGIEVIKRVRTKSPNTQIVVLSVSALPEHISQACQYGAASYVLKRSMVSELVEALNITIAGGKYLSPGIRDKNPKNFETEAVPRSVSELNQLTDREREVFVLVTEGKSSTEIGQILKISPRTAEIHRANMMRKLGFSRQIEVVRFALANNLIETPM